MKSVQFAFYMRTDEYGRRRKTVIKMTAEEAAKLADPEIIENSIEVRQIPESCETVIRPGASYPDCKATYPGNSSRKPSHDKVVKDVN